MQRMMMVLLLACTTQASAAQFSFERTANSPELNRLTLINNDELPIAGFMLTIGDDAKNFDSLTISVMTDGVVPMLVAPDAVNAQLRSDVLSISFANLLPGSLVGMKVDIDGDTGSQTVDWQTTLFNNGELPNAILTVAWEGGICRAIELPDDEGRDPFLPYNVTVDPISVPEPTGIVLALLGIASLLLRRFA